ncbi:bifunctional diguanylate cyclase/phosphodiesterase [Halorhodospira halochloris]|uniref:putative bifunctional diguanylate cyclase/phosphodiesterase n=1 Tax=Halorhodospira halochloris TaxID=1052 RepID=UPI001EE7AAA7|nr:bifunctional diguanylate cyclase/phosphodiesterase [Halorhodospira halochloris]MCG5531256.1 bifunctional diguanylate cyclase/phosphodiesterase [Halorhodospira halochloris]
MGWLDKLIAHLLAYWQHPSGRRFWVAILIIVSLVISSAALVYVTGGIKYVFAHSMYLPILLGGAMFGWIGGVLAGIAGGLALGPMMPIDTATGEMQEHLNWIFRLSLFVLLGGVIGALVQAVVKLIGQDPVSGAPSQLPLRHALRERIDKSSANRDTGFALLLVVFDNHAKLISTFGPEIGLKLVRGLVERLQAASGGVSKVYHIYGEHFAILAGKDQAAQLLEQIREHNREPINADGVPLYINLTIGRADCPDHGCEPEQIIQRATIAADTANQRGESEVTYDINYDSTNKSNLILLSGFREALASGQLSLYYQPKIDLHQGDKVVGFESLIRWVHPARGLLTPIHFIPQVEETHLIHDLTHWVIESAMSDLEHLGSNGLELKVAVNVSARNLHDPQLLPSLKRCMEATGVVPENFELEVTESAVLADPQRAREVLSKVRDWGLGVSIDDFGAGQTSLSYLKRLPASCLKIDRTFISNLLDDTYDQRIVEAVANLSKRLNMEVVAEGIEDGQTLNMVRELGCDVAQGYFIGKPQPLQGWDLQRGVKQINTR